MKRMAIHADMDLIANEHCETTEGPLWHAAEQALYWLDIPAGKLYRYDPATGVHGVVHSAGEEVGGYTIQTDGSLLLFGTGGSIRLLRGGEVTTLRAAIEDEAGSRFNDVIADPEGRVFCGTMPIDGRPGRLYRLDPDGSLWLVLEDAGLSNGMGFSPELTHFYHTDSDKGRIVRFTYDRETGVIGTGSVIVTISPADGVPDGMAVDEIGTIWSAIWDGSCLIRFAPDGTQMEKVWFPAPKVSSITFAGPEYRDAYVTLAGGNDPVNEGGSAGAVYRADLGVAGRPAFLSRIDPNGSGWNAATQVSLATIAPGGPVVVEPAAGTDGSDGEVVDEVIVVDAADDMAADDVAVAGEDGGVVADDVAVADEGGEVVVEAVVVEESALIDADGEAVAEAVEVEVEMESVAGDEGAAAAPEPNGRAPWEKRDLES
jgi:D-xylono/L-arabinono-1,4-lactonase